MKILVIEDERELSADICEYLQLQNYRCEQAFTYDEAIAKVNAYEYDCVLLDLMLPGGQGLDVLDFLKKKRQEEGVIIISAKDSLEDKIKGLQMGADDYLAKPFHQAELAARVYSVIRRKHFKNANSISQGPLEVNLLSQEVKVNEAKISLTKKEYELLVFFMGNKNRVISKAALAEHLSGDVADMFDNHDFVYAHVKNMKKKLIAAGCPKYLETVYGVGYRWES